MAKKTAYDNESISSLKGADRVRKRPGVIFGSDGLEGCEHAVFEILSNAIDEARGGYGKLITVTRFADHSVQVEDMGRGCPVDWNEKEGRYNWELVFCELYAGGKYDNESSENYEFSLGLNGLGSCATQYASRYMDVTVWRDGKEYRLHFERGEIVGKLEVSDQTGSKKRTGTTIRWLPDLEVFTDIAVPLARLVDGVGQNFKHRVFAALQPVRAEDDRRALAHAVRALQGRNAVIAVSLLLAHLLPSHDVVDTAHR